MSINRPRVRIIGQVTYAGTGKSLTHQFDFGFVPQDHLFSLFRRAKHA